MGFTKEQEATEQKASVLADEIFGSMSAALVRRNPSPLLSHHQRVNHFCKSRVTDMLGKKA